MGSAACSDVHRAAEDAAPPSSAPSSPKTMGRSNLSVNARGSIVNITPMAGASRGSMFKVQTGGCMYTGDYVDNKRHGIGKFVYSNGDWYDGQWQYGKAQGEGTFWTRTSRYAGAWDQDLKHGYGEEKFDTGHIYRGQFNQGFRSGKGELSWPDGSRYEGQFVNNSQDGQGTCTWSDKAMYVGQWQNNYLHGKGKYEWSDGSSYEGHYLSNLRHGKGIYMNKKGHRVECAWANGKLMGSLHQHTKTFSSHATDWEDGIMVSWALCSEASSPAASHRSRSWSPRGRGGSPLSRSPSRSPRGGGDGSPRSGTTSPVG